MRMNVTHWTRLAVVVVTIAGTQTGCSSGWNKTGWKMPGSDMFSWSRKPNEATLAGSSPSLAMPSGGSAMASTGPAGSPTSPAMRNTPSPISSTAANAGRANPYGPSNATQNGPTSGPSFSTPPGSMGGPMASNGPSNGLMGGAGSAALANGYTNGTYGMVSNAGRPGSFTPPSGFAAPNNLAPSSGFNPQMPNGAAPPTSFANAAMGLPPANMGMPPATSAVPNASNNAGGFRAPANMTPQNALANNAPVFPPAYGGPALPSGFNAANGINSAGTPAYTGLANSTVPAMPVGFNASALGAFPPANSSMPNTVPANQQLQTMPAVANQLPTSGYRPGSVGRSTAYDFSNPNSGARVPGAPSNAGLPPAFPATANGLPNGSPNTMFR